MNKDDYLKATQQLLRDSQQEQFPYLTKVLGREFVVYENVFSPKYFRETEIFAAHLVVAPDEHLLEIGSGTGAISVTKAIQGAGKVVAVDVNHEAAKNTRDNAMRHSVLGIVDVREGSLFQPIKPDEYFDIIFWNVPFAFIERQNHSILEKAVADPHYWAVRQYIEQGFSHLKPSGRLMIGFSPTLGNLRKLKKFCAQAKCELNLFHQEKSEEQYEVMFELFEVRPMLNHKSER